MRICGHRSVSDVRSWKTIKGEKRMIKAGRGKISLALVVLIVAFISVTPAYSDVIYSSYGAGNSYDANHAFQMTANQLWGFAFTPTVSSRLDTITLTVSAAAQYTSLDVLLMDSKGGLPHLAGELVGIFTTISNTTPQTLQFGISNITLTQGTQYWLVMESRTGTLFWSYGLDKSSPIVAAQGTDLGLQGGYNWTGVNSTDVAAFRVEGTPLNSIPEPGTLLLLGAGLIGLIGVRRKMNK
jgi:hypothetical protein